MTIAIRSASTMTAHAVCMAAGIRDSLRTAQFYVRDLSNADGVTHELTKAPTFLSRVVGGTARTVDWLLSRRGGYFDQPAGADNGATCLRPSPRVRVAK